MSGDAVTVTSSAANYGKLREAVLAIVTHSGDAPSTMWDTVKDALTIKAVVKTWSNSLITISPDEEIAYKGKRLPKAITSRLLAMVAADEDVGPIVNFWMLLQENPSYRSVAQLWDFMSHSGIPLDKDGYLLAYKAVREDYRDIHSGTFVNKPGATLSMPRNEVSDDPNVPCHAGLHVGALSYVESFGNDARRVLIVRVHPKDVVSVPNDYSSQKMRVCEYTVVGHYSGKLSDTVHTYDEDDDSSYDEDSTSDEVKMYTPAPPKAEDAMTKKELQALDKEHADLTNTLREVTGGGFRRPKSAATAPATTVSENKFAPTAVAPTTATGSYDYVAMDAMSMLTLATLSLDALRKYASSNLSIVGASKLAGGKPALLSRIEEVRRG